MCTRTTLISSFLALTLLGSVAFTPISAEAEAVISSTISGITPIDGTAAKVLFDQKAVFIDLRSQTEYRIEFIANALHFPGHRLPPPDVLRATLNIPQHHPIVLYAGATDPDWADYALPDYLQTLGYTHIYSLRGGFNTWLEHNYPVE